MRRLKTAVEPLTGALDRLLALRGTTFEYRAEVTPKSMYLPGRQIGFIAQEVEAVFPAVGGRDSDGFKTVGPQGFEALTVEALRDLRNEGTLIDAAQADEIRSTQGPQQKHWRTRQRSCGQRSGDSARTG